MYKNRAKLKHLLGKETGCTVQHDGWTCGTCFFPIVDEIKGLSDDNDHNYWLAVLYVRGDYDDFNWSEGYPNKDFSKSEALADELVKKLTGGK